VPTVLDHILLGCPDLDEGISFVKEHTGVTPVLGGVHPGRGEDPRPHLRCARCVGTHGPDYSFIAWRFHEH
jgi:hypothetical protein